jgi:hypothetical protein
MFPSLEEIAGGLNAPDRCGRPPAAISLNYDTGVIDTSDI